MTTAIQQIIIIKIQIQIYCIIYQWLNAECTYYAQCTTLIHTAGGIDGVKSLNKVIYSRIHIMKTIPNEFVFFFIAAFAFIFMGYLNWKFMSWLKANANIPFFPFCNDKLAIGVSMYVRGLFRYGRHGKPGQESVISHFLSDVESVYVQLWAFSQLIDSTSGNKCQ